MTFVPKVAEEIATAEVNALLDKKRIMPKQRERIKLAVEAVIEAVVYGLVTIHEDGSITQTLDTAKGGITEIKYKDRVEPFEVNKELQRVNARTGDAVTLAYQKLYSGQPADIFLKLEPNDKNIADCIALFFQ